MSTEKSKQENKSNELYTLLAVVRTIVGKKVRVIKEDRMDDACNIADILRWKIGDEFKVVKIECSPWGIFLYNGNGNNLNYKRAELIE
tara:strand:- start:953 stop:1216 length:264 start_codon:yes stop_codon:yes gene_type:complete